MSRYRFRPGWFKTLVVALLFPALVGLGFWQLDRAAQKTEIRDRHLARGEMAPVQVNERSLDPASMDFRKGVARGRYVEERTIYLDNRVQNGRPGYEVLTPLALSGSAEEPRYLLVNRGWAPWGEEPRSLPDIETPSGPVSVRGRLRQPPQDYFTLEREAQTVELRPRWQNLDLDRYARVTGLAVSPVVLQLDPAVEGAGGLLRRWPEYDDSWIERHRAYAVQWFALALTLVVIYVALNLKRIPPEHD